MKSNTWIITGTGAVSSLGVGAGEHLDALRGEARAMAEKCEDVAAMRSAPLPNLRSGEFPPNATPGARRVMAAAEQAAKEARLLERVAAQDVGVVVATCYGNLRSIAGFQRDVQRDGPRFAMPTQFPNTVISTASGHVAMPWKFTGANTTISAGRASGLEALATAADLLDPERVPAILCCGYEELSPELIAAYRQTGRLAPSRCKSLPFHPDSEGSILGEAAAAVILESVSKEPPMCSHTPRTMKSYGGMGVWEYGRMGGEGHNAHTPIHPHAPTSSAELAGYGSAYVSSRDSTEVKLAAQVHAMREAMSAAEINPEQISLVLAGANGQAEEDRIEALALAEVFGPSVAHRPVLALKSFVGECFAATGLLQVALAATMLAYGRWPAPMLALEKNGCLLAASLSNWLIDEKPEAVLVNAFDAYGVQSSVVLKRSIAHVYTKEGS
jgi:3-oxoacyl-(acyl-carrier-protein) synthase